MIKARRKKIKQPLEVMRHDLRAFIEKKDLPAISDDYFDQLDRHLIGKCDENNCVHCQEDIEEKRLFVTSAVINGVEYIYLNSEQPHIKRQIKIAVTANGLEFLIDRELAATRLAWQKLRETCNCDLCKAGIP